ncbi:MAG: O-antigen ligase family protein [Chloroflexi bacterium]|nr:O-antigen ligase family protein [Chloroflexota bacterium]
MLSDSSSLRRRTLPALLLLVGLLAAILIVRLTLLDATVVVLLGIGTLVSAVEPLAGLTLALFLGLMRAYLQTEVPQIPSQIGQVFVILSLGSWLAAGLARRSLRIRHSPLLLPLIGFLGTAILSLWSAVDLASYGLPEFIKWLQILAILVLVHDTLTPRKLPWLFCALVAIGLFQAAIGIYQFRLRGDGPDHFAILGGQAYRAYGTFEQPNPFAGFLGLTLSIVVGVGAAAGQETLIRWFKRKSAGHTKPELATWWFWLAIVAAALIAAALGMSWSRGAWIGFGGALLAMAAALPNKPQARLALIASLIIVGLGLFFSGVLPVSVTERLTSFAEEVRLRDVRGVGINDANFAVLERLAHWQAAVSMWRSRFWTGVGLGCYEPAYPLFALINWPIALGHAHNFYLTIAAETGALGLITYSIFWVAVFLYTWRATQHTRGLSRGLAIGMLGAWMHLSIHHVLDNLIVNNVHILIGVLLGLLAYIVSAMRKGVEATA